MLITPAVIEQEVEKGERPVDNGDMARRVGAFLLATGIVAVSCFAALIGLFWGFELRCDDSCSIGSHWRESPESWQWKAFGYAGLAGLGCAIVLLGAVAFRLRWVAVLALVAWAGLAWSFMTLFRDSGLTSNAERGWLGIVLLVLAGAVAIALTPPGSAPSGAEAQVRGLARTLGLRPGKRE